MWPAPRRRRPLRSLGWKLGWVAQVRPSLLPEALRLLRPSPRVLSLTGSDPQDPREERRVPDPSPFPARLACTSKLEKQSPSAPLTPGPAQKHLRLLRPRNRRGCPSPRPPVPRAPRAAGGPPCEAPRDTRRPESRGRPLDVQVGEPWSYSRGAGWDGKMGAHSKSQFAKTMFPAH